MVGGDALLALYLQGEEVLVGVFEIAHSCEGHLLLQVVPEPLTTNGVAIDDWDLGSEEASAVDQGLEGEAFAEGDGGAPVGIEVAHAWLVTHFGKVVGEVGIFHLETGTDGGEIPVVFGVVSDECVVAEVVVVLQCDGGLTCGEQIAEEMDVVPSDVGLQVEVAYVEVDGCQVPLVMVVLETVVTLS